MDARDLCAVGDALAEGFDGTTRQIKEVHEAVADRSFRLAGQAGGPAKAAHDTLARRVYATLLRVGPAAIRSSALALGMAFDAEADRIEGSQRGRAVVSAFNGVFGDALARRHNGLALRMSVRADGHDIPADPHSLAQAFPKATPKLALFVHGFGETDASWRWFAEASWGDATITYGEKLRRERGYTPLYLHYNSGRTIAENAAELSELLEDIQAAWPAPVRETIVIGHSAGGLIARAAIRHGNLAGARWVRSTSHVLALGTPRHAIAAEWLSLAFARLLERLPETRPLARLLDARSDGLKDLGDNDSGPLPPWVADVRLPKRAPRVGHFKLLNHPAVYAQISARLSDHSVPFPARAARGGRYERAAKALRAPKQSQRR